MEPFKYVLGQVRGSGTLVITVLQAARLEVQSVVGPNWLITELHGPLPGARGDAHMLYKSRFRDRLQMLDCRRQERLLRVCMGMRHTH